MSRQPEAMDRLWSVRQLFCFSTDCSTNRIQITAATITLFYSSFLYNVMRDYWMHGIHIICLSKILHGKWKTVGVDKVNS